MDYSCAWKLSPVKSTCSNSTSQYHKKCVEFALINNTLFLQVGVLQLNKISAFLFSRGEKKSSFHSTEFSKIKLVPSFKQLRLQNIPLAWLHSIVAQIVWHAHSYITSKTPLSIIGKLNICFVLSKILDTAYNNLLEQSKPCK